MSWRETVASIYEHWDASHRQKIMEALAQENDYAESLGFTCEIDDRRGGGWCKFVRDNVRVWECLHGWVRAECIRDMYQQHRYFHTLGQALRDEHAFAVCNVNGGLEYIEEPVAT